MATYGPEYIVLNQGYEYRRSASGKSRVSVVVKSEPLVANLDPKELGKPVAAAIVNHLRARVRGITARASEATLRYRDEALKAFVQGKSWAQKRYSGGRTGSMPPMRTENAFNDSGRLASSIVGNASSDGAWRINVAGNRLTDKDSGGVARIFEKLASYVPEFVKPELLLESDFVKRAIKTATQQLIQKQQARTSELTVQLARSIVSVARQVLEIGDALAA